MQAHQTIIAATFVVYVAAMLVLGLLAWRRTRSLSDYILGGRSLGRWVTALSAGASDMSGWLLLGLPGYAYVAGLESVWISIGLLAGTWLNWRLVAGRLRVATEAAGNALTLPEFLEQHLGDRSRLLRGISAFFILLFFLFYTSSGLVAGGKLFETVFDLPYTSAVISGTTIIIIYTFIGGFLAVSWTDVVQGLLMALALIIVPLTALSLSGGWADVSQHISSINPALLDAFTDNKAQPLSSIAILSLLGWGLGYFGQPHILARFMAARSAAELVPARRIAVIWTTLSLCGATLVGLAGIGYLADPLPAADSEKVFMHLVAATLHPVPAGICLAAILAAIMSTADSQLLVSSSAMTEDIYKGFFRPDAGDHELVTVGRITVLIVAMLAMLLALQADSQVLDLVAYAWAGFGAAFGPVILLSLYWPRMSAAGAIAGVVTGGVTVVVWKQLAGGWFDLYEIIPGFTRSLLAIVLVSMTSAASRSGCSDDPGQPG